MNHEATALHHLAIIHFHLGDTLAAKNYLDQALVLCNDSNNLIEKIKVLMTTAEIQAGDPAASIHLRKELQETIDRVMPQSLFAANNLYIYNFVYASLQA